MIWPQLWHSKTGAIVGSRGRSKWKIGSLLFTSESSEKTFSSLVDSTFSFSTEQWSAESSADLLFREVLFANISEVFRSETTLQLIESWGRSWFVALLLPLCCVVSFDKVSGSMFSDDFLSFNNFFRTNIHFIEGLNCLIRGRVIVIRIFVALCGWDSFVVHQLGSTKIQLENLQIGATVWGQQQKWRKFQFNEQRRK